MPESNPFRITRDNRPDAGVVFARPLVALLITLGFAVVLSVFVWRLFGLQVMASEQLLSMANGNRVREVVEYAPRGVIYDRNGKSLADNEAGFQLYVTPYQLPTAEQQRRQRYQLIAKWTAMKPAEVAERAESQGLNSVLPIAIGRRLEHATALEAKRQLQTVEGVELSSVPVRNYARAGGLSHILGYTGLVNQFDLETRDDLSLVDYVGRAGIEQQYDDVLRGENGFKRYEVDAQGKPVRLLASKAPLAGQNIHLTIDLDAQRSMARSISTQLKQAGVTHGSGVALKSQTGQVLALVSLPDYDNNLFARGITSKQYQQLTSDTNKPLFNAAVNGNFPSGSIIKPVVASAALQEKVVTENTVIYDGGYIEVVSQYDPSVRYRFNGWRPGGLGPMNVRRAIAMSSNIYFFTVGGGHGGIRGLGADRLTDYYKKFGLGSPTGIDLPSESSGLVPTPEWKQRTTGTPWTQGDTFNISIGQGNLQLTPLQITRANNVFATGGRLVTPQLLYKQAGQRVEAAPSKRLPIDQQYVRAVQEGMREVVVNGATGAYRFAAIPVQIAGKSGTAEQNTDANQPSHAWFTAYAPYDKPEVMATVLIEEGGSGSTVASPAIASFLEDYFTAN